MPVNLKKYKKKCKKKEKNGGKTLQLIKKKKFVKQIVYCNYQLCFIQKQKNFKLVVLPKNKKEFFFFSIFL